MKTAIYIEDGVVQLVLTPEGEFEKNALASFENKPMNVRILVGQFYDCRGGWARHSDVSPMLSPGFMDRRDRSLILRVEPEESEVHP